MRQLLFFDLDDTLLDHHGSQAAAQRETWESHPAVFDGVDYATWFPRYYKTNVALWDAYGRGEVTPQELRQRRFAEPLAESGLDPSHADALSGFYMASYARHWRLTEGAEEILEEAARHGTVGVLTNGFSEVQRAKLKRFDRQIGRFIEHLVLSEEVGAMKPSRVIFDAAWKRAGNSEPMRRVYVGDSFAHDVLGSKAAGWLPVLFNPLSRPLPAPVLYVTRLTDLKPLLS